MKKFLTLVSISCLVLVSAVTFTLAEESETDFAKVGTAHEFMMALGDPAISTIELTNDIVLHHENDKPTSGSSIFKSNGFATINRPITINGENHTLSFDSSDKFIGGNATIFEVMSHLTLIDLDIILPEASPGVSYKETYATRVFNVQSQTQEIDINFSNVVISAPHFARGISFYDNKEKVTINMENSELTSLRYTLNVASLNREVEINVTDSVIRGWAAVQTYSSNTKAVFERTKLFGTNVWRGKESDSNDYTTVIIFQEDGTKLDLKNVQYTFIDCEIYAREVGDGSSDPAALQLFIRNDTKGDGNNIFLKDTRFFHAAKGVESYQEVVYENDIRNRFYGNQSTIQWLVADFNEATQLLNDIAVATADETMFTQQSFDTLAPFVADLQTVVNVGLASQGRVDALAEKTRQAFNKLKLAADFTAANDWLVQFDALVKAEANYTSATFDAFKQAVADLRTLLDGKNERDLEKTVVDEAVALVVAAHDALVFAAKTDEAVQLISDFDALVSTYTTQSYQPLMTAIDALRAVVLAPRNFSRQEAEQLVSQALLAFDGLVLAADFMDANDWLVRFEALAKAEADYTSVTFDAFKQAVSDLRTLIAGKDERDLEKAVVDEAVARVSAAHNALVFAAKTDEAVQLINDFESLVVLYTTHSYQPLVAAIDALRAVVLAPRDFNRQEAEQLVLQARLAFDGLVPAAGFKEANDWLLRFDALVKEEANYTQKSFDVFKQAVSDLRALLAGKNEGDLMKVIVDEAVAVVKSAHSALVFAAKTDEAVQLINDFESLTGLFTAKSYQALAAAINGLRPVVAAPRDFSRQNADLLIAAARTRFNALTPMVSMDETLNQMLEGEVFVEFEEGTFSDEATNVQIVIRHSPQTEAAMEQISQQILEIFEGEQKVGEFIVFSITPMSDNVVVNVLDGKFVEIMIPIPQGLDPEKPIEVFHVNKDGSLTQLESRIEDNMIIFIATDFSDFVFANVVEVVAPPRFNNAVTLPITGLNNTYSINIAMIGVGTLSLLLTRDTKKRKLNRGR